EATVRPLTWVFMRSAIARPAASSLALLTRRPDDRRCMVVLRDWPDSARLRCALIEAMLVLIVAAIAVFPLEKRVALHRYRHHRHEYVAGNASDGDDSSLTTPSTYRE